jgi:hypothetical protein
LLLSQLSGQPKLYVSRIRVKESPLRPDVHVDDHVRGGGGAEVRWFRERAMEYFDDGIGGVVNK